VLFLHRFHFEDSNGFRSRRGDYNGIALDPGDNTKIWMFAEYAGAASGSSDFSGAWATWFGQTTFSPPSGGQISFDPEEIHFWKVEVNDSSLPIPAGVQNIGNEILTITAISDPGDGFVLEDVLTLPANIAPGNSLTFAVRFVNTGAVAGLVTGAISISSSDADDPTVEIPLDGTALPLGLATPGALYATGAPDGLFTGFLITIDRTEGYGEFVGSTHTINIEGLAINSRREIYGIADDFISGVGGLFGTRSALYKINAVTGTATKLDTVTLSNLDVLAFDADDVLYSVRTTRGWLYTINTKTAQITFIGDTGLRLISGLSFSPAGILYASTNQGTVDGVPFNSQIYTIDPTTAQATLVGDVGPRLSLTDIAFDQDGNLFGIADFLGGPIYENRLVSINSQTGAAQMIGIPGFGFLDGLCFAPDNSTGVASGNPDGAAPKIFSLEQSFPNPFNSSTKISYSITRDSHVSLKIYNLLGQEIRLLVDKKQNARRYEVLWDGRDEAGVSMPSGVYFYQLRAEGQVVTKRMLFLR
jgi:hypothetical protein